MVPFALVLVIIGAVLLILASPRKGRNVQIVNGKIKITLPEITGWFKIPLFVFGLASTALGIWMGVLVFVNEYDVPITHLPLAETLTPPTLTNTSALNPTSIDPLLPTIMPTLNPNIIIDEMDRLINWKTSLCDETCAGSNGKSSIIDFRLVPGSANNINGALEISYEVKNSGYVIITKNVDAQILSGTKGLSFLYKGSGAPNTIELKLLLRYPGDSEDIVFGASWNRATDTSGNWILVEAPYSVDFTCWWPADLCQIHGEAPDLTVIKRIDFAISNKPNDVAGTGKVSFDYLEGIRP